jgi:hypothetical protein
MNNITPHAAVSTRKVYGHIFTCEVCQFQHELVVIAGGVHEDDSSIGPVLELQVQHVSMPHIHH